MKITMLKMSKKKAYNEWKVYREALKNCKTKSQLKYLSDMKLVYNKLKSGRKIIDIFEVFKKFGVNTKEQPRLAIAPVSFKVIKFRKETRGTGIFIENSWGYSCSKNRYVGLPENTFKEWTKEGAWDIKNKEITTKVPIVPARYLPTIKSLDGYFVLWEVKRWDNIPTDPILLKRLTNNLFVVLAIWDLTPIEQAVVRGR